MVAVKICGIKEPETLKAAVKGGASYIGLVFYPPSPRAVSLDQAITLSGLTPDEIKVTGLFVDPGDDDIRRPAEYAWLDIIQLHGNESPERVRQIKEIFGLPIIKAFRIGSKEDIDKTGEYKEVADWFLFDTKAEDSGLPGGSGKSFDWNMLAGRPVEKPWILSGGLNAGNVLDALEKLAPDVIDLSSGLEIQRGEKSPEKISAFFDVLKGSGNFSPSYIKSVK
jgi:phosphoribosylanthranilate isomerase